MMTNNSNLIVGSPTSFFSQELSPLVLLLWPQTIIKIERSKNNRKRVKRVKWVTQEKLILVVIGRSITLREKRSLKKTLLVSTTWSTSGSLIVLIFALSPWSRWPKLSNQLESLKSSDILILRHSLFLLILIETLHKDWKNMSKYLMTNWLGWLISLMITLNSSRC